MKFYIDNKEMTYDFFDNLSKEPYHSIINEYLIFVFADELVWKDNYFGMKAEFILDNIITLLGINQFFTTNFQITLCHIDRIELLGNILFRTQSLQCVADIGILIIVFDLLQFHLTLVISKDGLRELQVKVVAERLVTGLRTVDIGVVILPAETVD